MIDVPTGRITDWEMFHDVFAEVLGFPDFYGRNMSAWHDCLLYADRDVGMLNVVPSEDVLTLAIAGAGEFARADARRSTTRSSTGGGVRQLRAHRGR